VRRRKKRREGKKIREEIEFWKDEARFEGGGGALGSDLGNRDSESQLRRGNA